MYARVPAIDGVPQVGAVRLVAGVSISPTEAVAIIDGPLQPGWVELTEAEYLALGGIIPGEIQTAEERIAKLEQVIDTLLTGGEIP